MYGLIVLAAASLDPAHAATVLDLARFPDSRPAWYQAVEYYSYTHRLAVLNADVPEFGYDRPMKQAHYIFNCWDALDDARIAARSLGTAGCVRSHLDRLRKLVGDENYRQGFMPLIGVPPESAR